MTEDYGPSLLKEWDLRGSDEILLKKRQVLFFFWTNRGIKDFDLPENRNVDICVLTPLALKAAGLLLSPYYAQILRL